MTSLAVKELVLVPRSAFMELDSMQPISDAVLIHQYVAFKLFQDSSIDRHSQ